MVTGVEVEGQQRPSITHDCKTTSFVQPTSSTKTSSFADTVGVTIRSVFKKARKLVERSIFFTFGVLRR
jgi:hypothetical protein